MAQKTAAKGGTTADDVVVVKKYANRRLYNTASSTYVTLEDLSDMVKEGVDFVVYDAKSGDDITRPVLTQIIFEQESRGQNLLPVQFLRRLIRFYGDSLQSFVPSYLEMSMEAFSNQRETFRERFADSWSAPAMDAFRDQTRKNMELFDQAMRMFAPFPGGPGEAGVPGQTPPSSAPSSPAAGGQASSDDLKQLREDLAAMQEKLNALTADTSKKD